MTSHNIEDFIEHSSSVPRDVVRICKTVREVEELSIKKMQELDENRKTFLMNKKGKGEKTDELKNKIDKEYKFLMELNDYKYEQFKDLDFIIKGHIKELDLSINEYEVEYKQLWKCSPNINSKLLNFILNFIIYFLLFKFFFITFLNFQIFHNNIIIIYRKSNK
jgi:hypothetical protein